MPEHRTVLLRHECGPGSHFDWMVEDPDRPPGDGPLLTWRLAEPPSRWRVVGRVPLEAIVAHRREYLTREGELTGGRGSVRRVDEGTVRAEGWSSGGGRLSVRMSAFSGMVAVVRAEDACWELRVVE